MSPSSFNALVIVVGAGVCGVPVRQIAERMVVRDPDISRLVDGLERAGYVERVRAEADRRVVEVHATEAGRAFVADMRPRLDAIHVAQCAHLGKQELERLNESLVALRRNAESSKGDER